MKNVEDVDVTALKVAVEMTEAEVEKPVVMAAVVNQDLVLKNQLHERWDSYDTIEHFCIKALYVGIIKY